MAERRQTSDSYSVCFPKSINFLPQQFINNLESCQAGSVFPRNSLTKAGDSLYMKKGNEHSMGYSAEESGLKLCSQKGINVAVEQQVEGILFCSEMYSEWICEQRMRRNWPSLCAAEPFTYLWESFIFLWSNLFSDKGWPDGWLVGWRWRLICFLFCS